MGQVGAAAWRPYDYPLEVHSVTNPPLPTTSCHVRWGQQETAAAGDGEMGEERLLQGLLLPWHGLKEGCNHILLQEIASKVQEILNFFQSFTVNLND